MNLKYSDNDHLPNNYSEEEDLNLDYIQDLIDFEEQEEQMKTKNLSKQENIEDFEEIVEYQKDDSSDVERLMNTRNRNSNKNRNTPQTYSMEVISEMETKYCKEVLRIEDFKIKFPNVSYKVQQEYMTCAMKALKNREYAALEMPTGTGKTLCLLSATLSYMENLKQNEGLHYKLIYTSRTHSQLNQVRKEIRKSPYQYYKSVTIASRDQYCLNQNLKQNFTGQELNKQCQLTKSIEPGCEYYKTSKIKLSKTESTTVYNTIPAPNHVDIEDLCRLGEEHETCPYFSSKQQIMTSDIIFMPYNYILDFKLFDREDIDLTKCIIIIDEGHNFTSSCKDASSITLRTGQLITAKKELKDIVEQLGMKTDSSDGVDILDNIDDRSVQQNSSSKKKQKKSTGKKSERKPNLYSIFPEKVNFQGQVYLKPTTEDIQKIGILVQTLDRFMKIERRPDDHDIIRIPDDKTNSFEGSQVLHERAIERIFNASIFKDVYIRLENLIGYMTTRFDAPEISSYTMVLEGWRKKVNQEEEKQKGGSKSKPNEGKINSPQLSTNALDLIFQCCEKLKRIYVNNFIKLNYFIQKEKRPSFSQVMDDFSNKTAPDHFLLIKDYIEPVQQQQQQQLKRQKIEPQAQLQKEMNVYCFNAGFMFKDIMKQKPVSILITSGTLSPFETLECELETKFGQKISGDHVIQNDQILPIVCKQSQRGTILTSKYGVPFQQKIQIDEDYGQLILDASNTTEGGILVFFSSYSSLTKYYEIWMRTKVIFQIERKKRLFTEKQNKQQNQRTIAQYLSELRNLEGGKDGAVLFGVCRGNFSEGFDFSDCDARCVIMIGMPFAQISDPKLILQKLYLDMKKQDPKFKNQTITGGEWYVQQTWRAINQAVGRVIRHKNDYGVIILADERYSNRYDQQRLPSWLRKQILICNRYEDIFNLNTIFINNLKQRGIYQPLPIPSLTDQESFQKKILAFDSDEEDDEDDDDNQYILGMTSKNTTQTTFKNKNFKFDETPSYRSNYFKSSLDFSQKSYLNKGKQKYQEKYQSKYQPKTTSYNNWGSRGTSTGDDKDLGGKWVWRKKEKQTYSSSANNQLGFQSSQNSYSNTSNQYPGKRNFWDK